MKIRVDKRRWRFVWWNLVLVVLALVCLGLFRWMAGQVNSLDAARQWQGGNEQNFTQLACFLPEDSAVTRAEVEQFRRTLDSKLLQASMEAPSGGSLYADAWSASAKVQISGDHGSAQVRAIGVDGDFFLFHPLELCSGSYLSARDLMQDRVVLDETLAWQLFGGSDVAGMSVTIDGKPFYVAGVVRREGDLATQKAYLDGAGLFMSFDGFAAVTGKEITCYEIVLPDPVSGFGYQLVKESFPLGQGDLVENTTRYSLTHLLSVAGDFGTRSMRNNGVIYPYWENAVRFTEDYLALLLVLMVLFLLCPVVSLTVELVRALVKTGKYAKKKIPAAADAAIEKRREARYARRQKPQP